MLNALSIATGIMKFLKDFMLISIACIWSGSSGYTQSLNSASNNNLSITIDSKVLKEKCKAWVGLPENYKTSTEKYPVVYILDGETFFTYTAGIASQMSLSGNIPRCIVIGVTSHNRQRDFTTPVDKDAGQNNDINTSGGANTFLDYLEKELIPSVERNYRTTPYRIIIGHSLGGVLVYHAFYSKPQLFQAYISIDGSLWWNKGRVGKSVISYITSHPTIRGKIFECRKDITQPVHFPVNLELLDYLKKYHPALLEYTYLELKNENHATIVYPGIQNGLKDVFTSYNYRSSKK